MCGKCLGDECDQNSLISIRYFGRIYSKGWSEDEQQRQRKKNFQTPYGSITVGRHVYQSSQGGKTYSPMESHAQVICKSTPKFAKQVSSKYGRMGSYEVAEDLSSNHGRLISRNRIQAISECVGSLITDKERGCIYELPAKVGSTKIIVFSMDGTTANMVCDGWRETMCGTISFYNGEKERLHSIYLGQAPEYGKGEFKKRFQREIDQVKAQFPHATYIGLADGALDNWSYLDARVDYSILDFWHAAQYLNPISKIVSRSRYEQKQWLVQKRHQLRNEKGGAKTILNEMKKLKKKKLSLAKEKELHQSITYYSNHIHQMDYPNYEEQSMPIGSGVTEAACKVLVKQRFCNSGMRWKEHGMNKVLSIRSHLLTKGRWEQIWFNVDRFGVAA